MTVFSFKNIICKHVQLYNRKVTNSYFYFNTSINIQRKGGQRLIEKKEKTKKGRIEKLWSHFLYQNKAMGYKIYGMFGR